MVKKTKINQKPHVSETIDFHFGTLLKNSKTGKDMTGWAGWQHPIFMAAQLSEKPPGRGSSRFSHIVCLWWPKWTVPFGVSQPPHNTRSGKAGKVFANCLILKPSSSYKAWNSCWKRKVLPPKRLSKAFINANRICVLLCEGSISCNMNGVSSGGDELSYLANPF